MRLLTRAMDITTICILISFALAASFVQRVCGFGFGIFIMSVLPHIMPSYGEATTLSGLLASATSLIIVVKLWRHIEWRKLLPILATFLIVSYFGVQLISTTSDTLLKRALGAVLIAVGLYFLFIRSRIALQPTLPTQISMGTLSGLMGGTCGMQGPPAVLYFLAATSQKEAYIAISQAYFLIGNLMMTLYRARHGYLTAEVGIAWCYGLIAVIAGTYIGGIVFRRISIDALRKLIYIYLIISGIVALFLP